MNGPRLTLPDGGNGTAGSSRQQLMKGISGLTLNSIPQSLATFLYMKRLQYQPSDDPTGPEPQPDPNLATRPGFWTYAERDCVDLMIAHERVADSGAYGAEPSFWMPAERSAATVH